MYKVIHLIKRKPHLTHEQFREHFERPHGRAAAAGQAEIRIKAALHPTPLALLPSGD